MVSDNKVGFLSAIDQNLAKKYSTGHNYIWFSAKIT